MKKLSQVNKVYNVKIEELIQTLKKLSQHYRYADFEIETSDISSSSTKLVIYPVVPSKQVSMDNIVLDPNSDLTDLV